MSLNENNNLQVDKKAIDKLLECRNRNYLLSLEYIKKQTSTLKTTIENVSESEIPIRFSDIQSVVKNPNVKSLYPESGLSADNFDIEAYKRQLDIKRLAKKSSSNKKNLFHVLPKKAQINKKETISKLNNYHIGPDVIDEELVDLIKERGIRKILILSDTAYTRHLNIYQKIATKLQELDIPFVEFTNIQPKITRKLLFHIADMAHEHSINAVFVVGSDSTIDISKLLVSKILKPNLMRLNRDTRPSILSVDFSIFSFPTFVVPDEKVNSKSLFHNQIFFKKNSLFSDTIFLAHPIDNSDAVFYYTPYFLEISHDKQMQIMHETFFRLIFNFFDEKATEESKREIIANIKSINWYCEYIWTQQQLTDIDLKIIVSIIASTVDGSTFVDEGNYWSWYRLEASLSDMVNSKKSEGLALFLPSFLESYEKIDNEFQKRATELAEKLYDAFSVNGLIYKLLKYIEHYRLPTKILEIKNIKKIDYKFLSYLIRRSTNRLSSSKLNKTIVKNLAIW